MGGASVADVRLTEAVEAENPSRAKGERARAIGYLQEVVDSQSQLSAVLTIDTVCRDINWRSGVVDDGAVCRVMVVCLAMLQLSCACPCLFFFSREAELAVPPIHQTSRHRKLLCTII